ncbi:MAG: cytochrome c biogenesis protein CcsA [Candidatus Omnitrophica bacterium]|nr:cytochrome c biogenesis protein CcsA [Candidatus Omnitrophota bacterium]
MPNVFKNHMRYSIFVVLLTLGLSAKTVFAQDICPLDTLKPTKIESLDSFSRIPVLNEGRVKPMETYAKGFLLRLSGRRSYQQENATQWFARFIFAPRSTYGDKIFLNNNPEIPEAIKIEPEKRRRYSWKQLEGGYNKIKELAEVIKDIDEKELSVVEREILRLYSNMQYYIRVSGAFAYAFPHPDFDLTSKELKEKLGLTTTRDKFSFYDLFLVTDKLAEATAALRGGNAEDWSEEGKTVARLVNAMFFWTEHYGNAPFGVIPTFSHEEESWLSPMDIMRLNVDQSSYFDEITHIRNMTVYYWNGEQLQFDIIAKGYLDSLNKRLSPKEKAQVDRFGLELFYNRLNAFLWAKLLYGLGFLFFLFSLMSPRPLFVRLTFLFTIAGFIPHLTAQILRILIMARPPVSNLFETFIFVGLVAAVLGFILEIVNKNHLGMAIASTSGLIFLTIAAKFGADGDTLKVLVAVLDSNFWLSTHVITITIGYAGCCVAGIMGHIYILQAIFDPKNTTRLNSTLANTLGILGFGLTATFLGTALGGIWADQSWGRFWGWDPKENGALMIVLWVALLFHARMAKLIHPLGVAVGSVLTLIVVMWAWFGVNLLSVGLHSYGFTSGIATSLVIYVLLELLFLGVTVYLLGRKGIKI